MEELGEKLIPSEKIEDLAKRINERIKAIESTNIDKLKSVKTGKQEKEKSKTEKKILRILEKDYIPRLRKYEVQEKILRNSYSKTDRDVLRNVKM